MKTTGFICNVQLVNIPSRFPATEKYIGKTILYRQLKKRWMTLGILEKDLTHSSRLNIQIYYRSLLISITTLQIKNNFLNYINISQKL